VGRWWVERRTVGGDKVGCGGKKRVTVGGDKVRTWWSWDACVGFGAMCSIRIETYYVYYSSMAHYLGVRYS
jgi:hypothetical protein